MQFQAGELPLEKMRAGNTIVGQVMMVAAVELSLSCSSAHFEVEFTLSAASRRKLSHTFPLRSSKCCQRIYLNGYNVVLFSGELVLWRKNKVVDAIKATPV